MRYIIVQAGGKGSRLGYLTENKPKALVPINNLPMLFHLFRKYGDKKYIIISDYKREVMHAYLESFANVRYQIVDASGKGTCAGIKDAIRLIPEKSKFMLIWSDLILREDFELPKDYSDVADEESDKMAENYVGLSETFTCRWKYEKGKFSEQRSEKYGVAGFFLFKDKAVIEDVPEEGEFVRYLSDKNFEFNTVGLGGTHEYGLLDEYNKLGKVKCRPFNTISVENGLLTKKAINDQGLKLAEREINWYKYVTSFGKTFIPDIKEYSPLKMEYISGGNIYDLSDENISAKKHVLSKVIDSLNELHDVKSVSADSFSVHEAYYTKTVKRLAAVRDLIPFADEKYITVNGRKCRNIYLLKREFEKACEKLVSTCKNFALIHGDCTFSNIMLRTDGSPVFIDPRGYFGSTELYGDIRYDWAKLYYSLYGDYDKFNLKDFRLHIGDGAEKNGLSYGEVKLEIESNGWRGLSDDFFTLTGANVWDIKFIHALIWLSLTTYAWEDYDSICGAFYNGIYYLEEVL